MPRCSVCDIRREQVASLERVVAQQASALEALTRALDTVRPAVASPRQRAESDAVSPHEVPETVRESIVHVAGYSGPMRDHLESWAQEALAFGMPEDEVARKIYEGDNE